MAGTGVVAIVLAMVKLVAFTSLTAPATASTIGEVSVPDTVGMAEASADAAIAAAAMLSGAVAPDAEVAGEAAEADVIGVVTVATARADESGGASGVAAVTAAMSDGCPELASAEASEVFSDFVCFDGFPAA
ncbi:MAG: hypothetical protein WBB98_18765 [Xanthobacteraceae bacterium]